MAIFIVENSGKVSYGIKRYICKTMEDIPVEVDGEEIAPGSRIYVSDEKKTYMLNTAGQWVEIDEGSGGASSIDELSDVTITSPQAGQVLVYDETTNTWINTANSADDKMDKINPTGSGSFSLNRKANTTIGTNSVAIGVDTTASGNYSYAEGAGTTASGQYSHAEGRETIASATNAHAEGAGTQASGNYSHTEGATTTASGDYSHAEGSGTEASGASAHAEGTGTTASTHSAHAEGSNTTASGYYSHAEGLTTVASKNCAHAEGHETTASANYSHAEGTNTTASGGGAHAEGINTTASGNYSHAEGASTIASGDNSHAEGTGTTAAGPNQHVSGRYNIVDEHENYAEIIGNGVGGGARSNARTLDWAGNEVLAGNLTINGNVSVDSALSDLASAIPTELNDLNDVNIASTPNDGQVLSYNTTFSKWTPSAPGLKGVELTQAQYDALTSEEKMNGTLYCITDAEGGGGGGGGTSDTVPFPNRFTASSTMGATFTYTFPDGYNRDTYFKNNDSLVFTKTTSCEISYFSYSDGVKAFKGYIPIASIDTNNFKVIYKGTLYNSGDQKFYDVTLIIDRFSPNNDLFISNEITT